MERFRPSAPFGDPDWMRLGADSFFAELDRAGHPLRPEFFRMLRRYRAARIRLIAGSALLVGAVVLLCLVPNLGETVLVTVILMVTLYHLGLVLFLRRRIAEAYQDLSLDDPDHWSRGA